MLSVVAGKLVLLTRIFSSVLSGWSLGLLMYMLQINFVNGCWVLNCGTQVREKKVKVALMVPKLKEKEVHFCWSYTPVQGSVPDLRQVEYVLDNAYIFSPLILKESMFTPSHQGILIQLEMKDCRKKVTEMLCGRCSVTLTIFKYLSHYTILRKEVYLLDSSGGTRV